MLYSLLAMFLILSSFIRHKEIIESYRIYPSKYRSTYGLWTRVHSKVQKKARILSFVLPIVHRYRSPVLLRFVSFHRKYKYGRVPSCRYKVSDTSVSSIRHDEFSGGISEYIAYNIIDHAYGGKPFA